MQRVNRGAMEFGGPSVALEGARSGPHNRPMVDAAKGGDYIAAMRAIAGARDRAAFATVFAYFAPRVKAYLMRLGSAADVAEDLVQDIMLTVWNRAETYDPALSGVATWIFTIARNRRIDALRRERRPEPEPTDPMLVPTHGPAADDLAIQGQRERILGAAVRSLPDEQARLLRLAFYEDRSHGDIAGLVALPLGTVKSRLRLALGKLRASVDPQT